LNTYFTVDRTGNLARNLAFGDIALLKPKSDGDLSPEQNAIRTLFPSGISMHGVSYLARLSLTDPKYTDDQKHDLVIELVFEQVRVHSFSHHISRFQSIFAFGTYAEAAAFGEGSVYKLSAEHEMKRYDMNWLRKKPSVDAIAADAFSYWSQLTMPGSEPRWEYLVSLPVKFELALAN
jgi:hypothetical protein